MMLLTTILFAMTGQTAWAWSGNGTSSSPYQITSTSDLLQLANDVHDGNTYSGKYFKLMNDLVFTTSTSNWYAIPPTFASIGTDTNPFEGTFDGDNHTLTGVYIRRALNNDGDLYQGLFGVIGSGAVVKNIILTDSKIAASNYSGAIAGENRGTITNCHVTSSVIVAPQRDYVINVGWESCYVGGIAGNNASGATISNCSSGAKIWTHEIQANSGSDAWTSRYGGIAGVNAGSLTNCFALGVNIGIVKSSYGAITGYSNGTLANNYYADCYIIGQSSSVGTTTSDGQVDITTNDGAVRVRLVTLSDFTTSSATVFTIPAHKELSGSSVVSVAAVNYNLAKVGATVTLGHTEHSTDSYFFSKYSVKDADNADVTVNSDNTFTMPDKNVTATAVFTEVTWTGSGTSESNPYLISSPEQLILLARRVNAGNMYEGKYFKLGANITYDGMANNFTPIGTNGKPFMGTFDGNGKTISGLNINLSTTDYVGLFGYVVGATIKGVKLDNSTIKGKQCVGGIVGSGGNRNTTVQNCAVTSTVTVSGTSSEVGGIVGHYATIRGCTSAAAVSGTQYVGGIIGSGASSTVEYCLYIGSTVTATYSANPFKGAITGDKDNTSMTANYYTQATVGGCNGADVDGARKGLTISKAANNDITIVPTGEATTYDVSKITCYEGNNIVKLANALFFYSGATETVSLGLSHSSTNGDIVKYYDGNGNELTNVGDNTYTYTMSNQALSIKATLIPDWAQKNSGDTEDDAYIISTAGQLDLLSERVNAGNKYEGKYFMLDADITYDKTKANNFTPIGTQSHYFGGTFDGNGKTISGLNINLSSTDKVGLFGNVSATATIKDVKLHDSTIRGKQYVGGILGGGSNSSTTVENCAVTSTVTVSGTSNVGGIVGRDATARGCTSAAAVSGMQDVGGIIGNGTYSTVERCLYTGSSVTSTYDYKGAITSSISNGSFTANYYTADLACKGVNGGDWDCARRAYAVTLPENVVPSGAATAYDVSGITYYANNHVFRYDDGTNSTYYAGAGASVTLSYTGNDLPEGHAARYKVNEDPVSDSKTITMPDVNATITLASADVWGLAAGANGESEATAYIITSTDGLDLLAQKVNAGSDYYQKFFKLDADITYDGAENNFTPIGTASHVFRGTFDGNGKTISGLNINLPETNSVGLFGQVSTTATIKGVKLDNSDITGQQNVGGILGVGGNKNTTVQNCVVTSTVTVSGKWQVGGIVSLYATVRGCTSAAAVSGISSVGGIIGDGTFSTIDHCLYTGNTVTATETTDPYTGAITGNKNDNTSLTANYYTADLACKGADGADEEGARKAVAIGTAEGVTIALAGDATTYNVSGITAYADNTILGCGGKLYLDDNTTTVKLNISYTVDGYVPTGYTDGNGNALTGNDDGTYTLTMTDAVPTITATTADVWGMAAGADGTSVETAYTITTTAGLDLLAQRVNAGNTYEGMYFELGDDITYPHLADGADGADTENNYTAIGNSSNSFLGKFDGKGYTISGIRIYKGGNDYTTDGVQGLFGYIGSYAEVKNVTLTDTRITAAEWAGGIVGNNGYGTIADCHVTNTVKILAINEDVFYHGGIVGQNDGLVSGCISEATLTGGKHYGGIVGWNSPSSTISGCISKATLINVSGGRNYGGIAGMNYGTLENNFVIGATIPSAQYNSYGAITGLNYDGTLKNNYYTACTVADTPNATNVGVGVDSNNQPVGDVVENDGALYDVWDVTKGADGSEAKPYTITTTAGLDLLAQKVNAGNFYYQTFFKLGDDITYPHLADDADGADTENNYTSIGNYYKSFEGNFDGNGKTISGIRIYKGGDDYSNDGYQGLFGSIGLNAEVKNVTLADTRITAASVTGGIVGSNGSGTITNCHVTNTVKILTINENVDRHGGIVGHNMRGAVSGCISEATLTSTSGGRQYGGIVGWNTSSGTISGCISKATLTNVSGGMKYGGIAGENSATLEDNFVIGATIPAATSYNSHGAIVGQNSNGTLRNNYYTACTVAGVENATNVGVGIDSNFESVGDVAANDGALSVHQITFAEGVTDVTIDAGTKAYSYDSKNYYVAGTTVKFTWTPATGYVFSSITAGEDVTGTLSGNTYTIMMPAKDVTVSVSFKKLLTNTDITIAGIADQTCTGSEVEPAITVKDGETDITGQCDITYSDNTAVGTATVTITAKATSTAYAGETTLTFDILREMSGLFADGNAWTGYVAQEDLTLPEGLTAYAITALGETTATAAALGYIPQGEPVLLCRSDKTSNLYRARAGNGTAPAGNLLTVATAAKEVKVGECYVLYQDELVLYGTGTLPAGTIYLPVGGTAGARRLSISTGGEATGIGGIEPDAADSTGQDEWYGIDGRRLDGKPTRKGLYIHNGRKEVVK